jgi:hypothetical protein
MTISKKADLLKPLQPMDVLVCRNVKRWRSPAMALRWTATAMLEAEERL